MTNKLAIGIIAVLVIIILYNMYSSNDKNEEKTTKEGFGWGLPSFQTKVSLEASQTSGANKGDFYTVPGTYQAMLSPRMNSLSYGPYVNYKLPEEQNLAVPQDPLSYDRMVKENFNVDTSGCSASAAAQKQQAVAPVDDSYQTVGDLLPVGDMTTVNSAGEESQVNVWERFMYANRNSRLRSQGDYFRGDLPIQPCAPGWFRPSVQPNVDLQQGALNVMGGFDNEQGQKLAALINTTSGGAQTAIAGLNLGNQFASSLAAGQHDVIVTAFP